MILGIGNDLVDIRRIEKLLAKPGAQFEKRVFTPAERQKASTRKSAGKKIVAATYAKRFAAKEACIKALATRRLSWQDMEITNSKEGVAHLALSGKALKRLQFITPRGKETTLHITMTDEYPYAWALVIIEAK